MEGGEDYSGQFYSETSVRIKDLEEKQSILKDRVLLIGKNLIETKESVSRKNLEVKKTLEEVKQELERMKAFLETISGEFSKFARKDDLEILKKQAKMFQPLGMIKKSKTK